MRGKVAKAIRKTLKGVGIDWRISKPEYKRFKKTFKKQV